MARKADDRVRQDTRERILAAALDVFADRGFEGAGITEIAERVGITKSVIYYHFKNKEAILEEIAARSIREVMALKQEIARGLRTGAPRPEDLEPIVDALVGYALANRKVIKVPLMESIKDSETVPLFSFWDANLELGTRVAREIGVDTTKAPAREALFEAFFMLLLPVVGYAVLEDKWAKHYGPDATRLRRTFRKVFQVNMEELWFKRSFATEG